MTIGTDGNYEQLVWKVSTKYWTWLVWARPLLLLCQQTRKTSVVRQLVAGLQVAGRTGTDCHMSNRWVVKLHAASQERKGRWVVPRPGWVLELPRGLENADVQFCLRPSELPATGMRSCIQNIKPPHVILIISVRNYLFEGTFHYCSLLFIIF